MMEFRVNSYEARVCSRDATHRWSATCSPATRNSQLTTRHAVTLIELLITITIVSILSAAFLGTSNLAMESSRKARTKTTIGKIHGLLMEKWSEYATRRVDVNEAEVRQAILANGGTNRDVGLALADVRLLARRELMKLEMPDRWSDVVLNGIPDTNPKSVAYNDPAILTSYPAITRTYQRRFQSLKDNVDSGAELDGQIVRQNQGAECLYMIIMLATADGEARTLFSEQDIGDTDGDGAPEFLDGWGNPIRFIRWPAGFVSALQPLDENGNRDAEADHDPFDIFRRDQPGNNRPDHRWYPTTEIIEAVRLMRRRVLSRNISAYRLVPLIYSYGPDNAPDLVVDTGAVVGVDPYAAIYGGGGLTNVQIGTVADANNDGDDNSLDNIHNHLQDNK